MMGEVSLIDGVRFFGGAFRFSLKTDQKVLGFGLIGIGD